MNTLCTPGCAPAQIITLSQPVNDINYVTILDDNGNAYDPCCLDWSYSLDGVVWSCWMKRDEAESVLVDESTDFFIRVKVNGSISGVTVSDGQTIDYSTSLPSCFDFSALTEGTSESTNAYNPYANSEYAVGLYQYLTESVSNIVGIPIIYFKLSPDVKSADITFKEYTLMNVESVKKIKLIVSDGMMPSSKPEFSEFGFDFSTDWETEISKSAFATAFGMYAQPMEGDLVYVPMQKRMWMVNGAYEEKNSGVMWQSTTFKVALVKYQEKGSVDLGDAQAFVDSVVKTKYDDLFGDQEDLASSIEGLSSPDGAFNPTYPTFQSDATRKYVKHSDGLVDINARLVADAKYHKGTLVADKMYDWTGVIDESFIVYQRQFCGDECSFSFIATFGNEYCKGTLLKIADKQLYIDQTPAKVTLKLMGVGSIEIESGETYFIYCRWSKSLNMFELGALKHTHPASIPLYKLQNVHWKFDLDNPIKMMGKYDVELPQENPGDVTLYSFNGKVTNIKVFDIYVENVTEMMTMYPNNNHLIINDTARKFVEPSGVLLR